MDRRAVGIRTTLAASALLLWPIGATLSYGQHDAAVSFSRDVKPLLARRCYACHGPDAAEAGLRLDDHRSALAERDGPAAIVPGDSEASELIRRITSDDQNERMPQDGEPLSAKEIALLRRWIDQGAEFSEHWAFISCKSIDPPEVRDESWVRNEIDRFILARLESRGLSPSPPAERRVLARRVYHDVTGLPPTADELNQFLNDKSPDAYQRLIEELLASPRYGERWARHWLDAVRYAETNSFERDAAKPYAWKYRDYVIRSLNEDKPYDQFVREQLAGDELDEVTAETIAATGYYRLGTWDDEPADPLRAKFDDLDNILSTTGQVFLGLTVGCARCHDHKIDPIPQTDYYSLLAFFADVTPYALPHRRDPRYHSLWDVSPEPIQRLRKELLDRKPQLEDEKEKLEAAAVDRMDAEDQRNAETDKREQLLKEKLAEYQTPEERTEYLELQRQLDELECQLKELPEAEWVLSLAECYPQPEPMHVMLRGNPHAPGPEVEPRFPELFGDPPPEIEPAAAESHSAGRRHVMADWIASGDNLLTARVIVNRVWQHHFGRGIVRSANNFGQIGTPPTHPELLDWLAGWIVEHDWRLKELHRLILQSGTYQMSSSANPEGLAADPANDLFWRFDMRRLSAEEIRDTVLLVSGRLNDKMFGPSIFPPLSEEVLQTQSRPGLGWETSDEVESARRSIYIHIKRSLIPPALASFDFPETDISCEARFNTTQPAQALNLLHSQFMQAEAGHLAERVRTEVGDDLRQQVGHVLRLALAREPDEDTVLDGLALIDQLQEKHGLNPEEAFRQYCLMVLNLNEFVYLD